MFTKQIRAAFETQKADAEKTGEFNENFAYFYIEESVTTDENDDKTIHLKVLKMTQEKFLTFDFSNYAYVRNSSKRDDGFIFPVIKKINSVI